LITGFGVASSNSDLEFSVSEKTGYKQRKTASQTSIMQIL